MSTVVEILPDDPGEGHSRGLSGDDLRALARGRGDTTEYGSPVYSTRVKSRSAKNTYVVAEGVLVGRMQQPIEPQGARRRSARSRKRSSHGPAAGGPPDGR